MPSHIFSPAVFSRFVAGSEQLETTQDFVGNSFVFTAVIPSEEWIFGSTFYSGKFWRRIEEERWIKDDAHRAGGRDDEEDP